MKANRVIFGVAAISVVLGVFPFIAVAQPRGANNVPAPPRLVRIPGFELVSTSLVTVPDSFPSSIQTGAVDEASSGSDLAECLEGAELMALSRANLAVDGSVRLVFDRPVVPIADEITGLQAVFRWFENLVDPDDIGTNFPSNPGFEDIGSITGTVTTLHGGLIFVVTPSNLLPENEFFGLDLFVAHRGEIPGREARAFTEEFYRPVLGGLAADITLDNYNGTTDGSGSARQVFIELPEVVRFEYKVFRIVDGENMTDFLDPVLNTNARSTDNFLVNTSDLGVSAQCTGSGPGTFFLVPLRDGFGSPVVLNDDSPARQLTVSLVFYAEDWEGNIVEGVLFDVPVQ